MTALKIALATQPVTAGLKHIASLRRQAARSAATLFLSMKVASSTSKIRIAVQTKTTTATTSTIEAAGSKMFIRWLVEAELKYKTTA
ncbi:hypothetical protein H8B02_17735 [Bradyrhizobium sp. Pear77]|uniref:hypothetical protein n=1 Tax=Bradyrhizobium altum TaxID=1571202 RepID=UPI001E2BA833|nr:hypothetical protein [Bradyrhizobium altum]MCC8955209.1 hypothetical protein [Bradyrhizobium altum]